MDNKDLMLVKFGTLKCAVADGTPFGDTNFKILSKYFKSKTDGHTPYQSSMRLVL